MGFFYMHTTLLIPLLPYQKAFLLPRQTVIRLSSRKTRDRGAWNHRRTIVQIQLAAEIRRLVKPALQKIHRRMPDPPASLIPLQKSTKL